MKTAVIGAKILLSILLLLCLLKMPYGYYQMVRFIALVVFALFSYHYYTEKKIPIAIIYGCLAILFQPIIKIALGRTIWNIVDVVIAIALLISLVCDLKKKFKNGT